MFDFEKYDDETRVMREGAGMGANSMITFDILRQRSQRFH
jgi:hypothetical protein